MRYLNPDEEVLKFPRVFPASSDRVLAGAGQDDCGIIRLGHEIVVISTDYVNAHPIGLELGISSFRDLGHYLVTCNLSDLLGSGAKPIAILISIMWSRTQNASD